MVKKTTWVFLTVVLLTASGCLSKNDMPSIPSIATADLKPDSTRNIAYFELSDWASNVQKSAYAQIFEGQLISTGEIEIRVFINDGENVYYAGALTNQLGLPEVETIFIDLGREKCIIGWVSSAIKKPYDFRIERLKVDGEQHQDAVKESTIEGSVFIVPIKDEIELWNTVVFSAIETTGSLQRGNDGVGSWYELEKQYDQPLDISNWYVLIPIQK